MNSWMGIASGKVWHQRLNPVKHRFEYDLAYLVLDLDDLEKNGSTPGLSRNQWGLLSLWNCDYLRGESTSLRSRILDVLQDSRVSIQDSKMILVTMPRFLGYAFNPVSFYVILGTDESLLACVAEVNNTFGERHLYVMGPEQMVSKEEGWIAASMPKVFHVSPFNPVDGEYEFLFKITRKGLHFRIFLNRDGKVVFRSGLELNHIEPMDRLHFAKAIFRMPLAWLGATTRILWHAVILTTIKKLKAFDKPEPISPWTIFRGPQIWVQRVLFPRKAF